MNKRCTRCDEQKPNTREFFGGTPSGGLKRFCRECEKKASRLYEAKNKDRRRVRDAKRAASGSRRGFDLNTKRILFDRQSGRCLCCLKLMESAEDGQVDHAKPLVKGGTDDASNLFLAHAQCNREKHGKTLPEHWEWRVRHGLDAENIGRKHGLLDLFSK